MLPNSLRQKCFLPLTVFQHEPSTEQPGFCPRGGSTALRTEDAVLECFLTSPRCSRTRLILADSCSCGASLSFFFSRFVLLPVFGVGSVVPAGVVVVGGRLVAAPKNGKKKPR